jgi:hypothetical protein
MTLSFDQARQGGNHHYPEGSDHQHWVFTFDNNRGAEVATDRDEPDRWWVSVLRDGYPDPDQPTPRGLTDWEVEELLITVREMPAFDAPSSESVPDDV